MFKSKWIQSLLIFLVNTLAWVIIRSNELEPNMHSLAQIIGVSSATTILGLCVAIIPSIIYRLTRGRWPDWQIPLSIVFITIATYSSHIGQTDRESLSETSQYFWYTEAGCNYKVAFPKQPEYINSFDQFYGNYIQAQYIFNDDSFVRAECIFLDNTKVKAINSQDFLQEVIVNFANNNGLTETEFHYKEDQLGKSANLRGFKKLNNKSATYQTYIYIGKNSIITLSVGGLSETYPIEEVYKFLNSIQLK